jgi:nucleotide-binding universal stress UspA family protein
LRFVEHAAAVRGASLQVMHAWTVPSDWPDGRAPYRRMLSTRSPQKAGETLRQSIRRASIDARRPDVEMWLVEGAPNLMLLQAASNADLLLVVGSRGYDGWKGFLLGSVSIFFFGRPVGCRRLPWYRKA